MTDASGQLSAIEKHLKNLVDDVQKKHPEMIVNWRELNSVSKKPLLQEMAENQRKIHCFIQLMGLCSQ
jgi:gas vesicle protein